MSTNRPTCVPDYAENIDVMGCLTTKEAPSQFLPGKMHRVFEFHCASCGTTQPEPKDHAVSVCPQCGLRMTLCGALRMWVWREREKVTA